MDYIPSKELALNAWVQNFASLIAANPPAYGLMASDAAGITAVQTAFSVALALATNPATKTSANVTDKDAKKATMLAIVRQYAQTIKRNLGIPNETKTALGLTIDDNSHTPIPAPTTQPILLITQIESLRHILRFADSADPTRRGKPAGAERLQLFKYIGTTPPASLEQAQFAGDITRQSTAIALAAPDVGKFAFYQGRWATRTGLTGPASAIVSAPIIN